MRKSYWNGYGGGIEVGESPEESAVRELREEAEIIVAAKSLEKVAKIYFHNTTANGSKFVCHVHVYLVYQWQGSPQSTSTMQNPTWFSKNQLPLQEMMPADRHWFPIILTGSKILAEFSYGPFQKKLLNDGEIQEVNHLALF